MKWNCAQICFHQYANYLFFRSNWNILAFLRLFNFLRFIMYSFCESIILSWKICFQKEKTLKKHCVYNHGNSCLFCFTYTNKYANYTSFHRFCWRQKCLLWFLGCLPFGPPFLFWLSEFFSFASEFSFQCFTEGKI